MENEKKKTDFRGFRGPHPGMGGTVAKARDFKKTWATFRSYLKPYRCGFLAVALLSVLATAFAVVSPKILGRMTDLIVAGFGSGAIDYRAIARIGLWLVGLYLASSLFTYIQIWITSAISQKITRKLRSDVADKITRLPLGYFDRSEKGNVISLVTNDVETISQNLNQGLSQALSSAVTVAGILAIMVAIDWAMALVAVLILISSFFSIMLVMKRSQRSYDLQQASLGEMDGHVEEMFSNHLVVKAFGGEPASIEEFQRINRELYDSGWKAQFLSGLMMPMTAIISNLGYVAVAVAGGWMAIEGRISIGDIQAFIQYMNQLIQPIMQVANIANLFQSTIAAAERIFDFLAEKERASEEDALPLPERIEGAVEFRDVRFGYEPGHPVIKGFSARIEPRRNVAIVGPTGAGKTTIVNLLMRFYEPDSGSIAVDGTDISKLRRQDVRRLFGMVLQDTWLFSGTIAENIAFGRSGATKEEIIRAAEEAHADHFIRTLPDGYDTVIADSIDNISAGEKQLLTIARAILADAPMLILDEATSSVDTRTERLIQSAMDRLMKGRTSFVIAHRLSTIRNADLILVMRDGNIVEQGRHEELLSKKGFYASLYNSQFAEE